MVETLGQQQYDMGERLAVMLYIYSYIIINRHARGHQTQQKQKTIIYDNNTCSDDLKPGSVGPEL